MASYSAGAEVSREAQDNTSYFMRTDNLGGNTKSIYT